MLSITPYRLLTFALAHLTLVTAQITSWSPETGKLGNATIIENNPPGVTFIATLPADSASKIRGSISATANPDGIGVKFTVNITNLPTTGGPFAYHLHANPVSPDGNCSSTLGHLDPFIRGESTSCDKSIPQTCQVGDLSGKHGKITSDPFSTAYVEEFASTFMGIGSFFGNRSLVIHDVNKTRLTCANFTMDDDDGPKSSTNSSSPIPFMGNASRLHATISISWLLLVGFLLI